MRNYDIELFHITGNSSDISVVGKPPRDVLPPIAPSGTNSTFNDGVLDEIAVNKFNIQVASEDAELFTIFLPISFDKLR
jgi:hypothetical protein